MRCEQVLTSNEQDIYNLLLRNHCIWQTARNNLVATDTLVRAAQIYIVGKITLIREVEALDK